MTADAGVPQAVVARHRAHRTAAGALRPDVIRRFYPPYELAARRLLGWADRRLS